MGGLLRVIIVEDNGDDAELVMHELRRGGFDPEHERVETAEAMAAALEAQTWDIVISDYQMPLFNGAAALALLQRKGLDLPFIIVSGTIGEETAVATMKAGAHDYLMKGNLKRLAPAVERELREAEVRRERKRAEEMLGAQREFLRKVIDTNPNLIFVKDWDGRFTLVNKAVAGIYGTPPESLVGKTDADFNANPEEVERFLRDDREVMETLREKSAEEPVTDAITAEVRWFQTIKVPLISSDGHARQVLGVATDITGRKRAEEHTQSQLQRLAALRNIDMAITSSLDLRVTLNIILDQVTTQLRVDAANILLFNPHSQRLRYATNRGFRTKALRDANLRLGEGHAGRAALERRIVAVPSLPDAMDEFSRSILMPEEGFIAYHAAPLIAKGQVKGVLETFHRSRLDPNEGWMDFLEALAGQAAIAIDNAALFDDLQRSNVDLTLAYDTTLEGWSRALDLRDKETEGHTQRVAELTIRLATTMGMTDQEVVHVRRGALLHDIGKMGIPDSILLKPGPLTDEEWVIMRKHPVYAYELLYPIAYLRPALDIPYAHHEKWDGTGYPRGLKGEQIPLAARIFAVIDVWDALRSDRPYRPAWTEEKARDYIREQSGKHFDPRLVEAFLAREL